MKKIFIILVAVLSLAFASCSKEKSYTIHYTDNSTSFANVTVFEYMAGGTLVAKRELKDIDHQIYQIESDAMTDFVVIGVEGIIGNKIIEWYSCDRFYLDEDEVTNIDVSFIDMNTQATNPINPDDCISRYIY